jgi:hypothetical protein
MNAFEYAMVLISNFLSIRYWFYGGLLVLT